MSQNPAADAKPGKPDGDPIGERGKLTIGESADLARVAFNGGQRQLVRAIGDAAVEGSGTNSSVRQGALGYKKRAARIEM